MTLRIVALICISASLAFCQSMADLDNGMKPYGAFHGGSIDSVSLANGNLNLHIPLISYPQRGGKLGLDFYIGYHSKAWSIEELGDPVVNERWRYGMSQYDNLNPGVQPILAQGYTAQ